jgi:hypothetical protein
MIFVQTPNNFSFCSLATESKYLLVAAADAGKILKLDLNPDAGSVFNLDGLRRPVDLDFHLEKNILFYTDVQSRIIW